MADVYGRLTGRARGRHGDARARRHEPRDRHRRRLPRPRPDGRAHRPDRLGQAPQGSAPVVDIVRHVRAGDEVEHARRADRRDPRDRAQGVPRRAAREARADPHRAAREPRRACPSPTTPGRSRPTRTYFPEPTDEAIAHAARLLAGSAAPARSWPATASCGGDASDGLRAFARGLHVPVAVTFMGKGAIDDRSHLSLMAVGLQARDHVLSGLRPGRPRRLGRLRPRRVRAVALEPGRHASGSSTSTPQPAEVDAALPARGRARSATSTARCGGCSRPSCRSASAAGTRPSATRPRRSSSTPTCARRCSPTSTPTRRTTAGRSSRRRRSPTCARALGPHDIVVSDVGAHKVWVARLYQAYEPNTVIISNGFAAMGISLPGRDRGQARPPGPAGRRPVRRRRLPDELRRSSRRPSGSARTSPSSSGATTATASSTGSSATSSARPFGVEFGNPDFVAFAQSRSASPAFRPIVGRRPRARRCGARSAVDGPSLVEVPDRLPREPAPDRAAGSALEFDVGPLDRQAPRLRPARTIRGAEAHPARHRVDLRRLGSWPAKVLSQARDIP